MTPWQWQMVLLCSAFFVTGFLTCALVVAWLRDRVLDRHVARCERDIFAPFLPIEAHRPVTRAPAPQPPQPRPRHARPGDGPGAPSIRLDAFDPPDHISRHGSD